MDDSPILITGAEGMLGKALRRNAPSSKAIVYWDQKDCDLTNQDQVGTTIVNLRPRWVVNCAAYNAVDECETHPDQAFAVNADAVRNVGSALSRIPTARLLHVSTDYVFDGFQKEGYTEQDQPHPISIYGESKYAGEQHALAAASSIVVRTSRIFGIIGTGKKSFVDIILERAKEYATIEAIDAEVSSPTWADDLAQGLWELVVNNVPGGIYHRTNDGSCTWYEFAQEILNRTRWKGTLRPIPASNATRRAQRPAYSVLQSTKLPPLRNWKQALQQYLSSDH